MISNAPSHNEQLAHGYRNHRSNSWKKFGPQAVFCFYMTLLIAGFGVCIDAYGFQVSHQGFTVANFLRNHGGPSNATHAPNSTMETSPGGGLTGIIRNGTIPDDFPHNYLNKHHILWLYILVFGQIPTFLASFYGVVYLTNILNHHALNQAMLRMYRHHTTAKDSILLEYITGSPFRTALQAWKAGHWKLFYLAVLQIVSNGFPITVGTIISSASNNGEELHFTISATALTVTFIYLTLYILSMPWYFPTRQTMLVHPHWNIAHLMSLCFASHLVRYPEFNTAGRNMDESYFKSNIITARRYYGYGTYVSESGRRHTGFDDSEFVARLSDDPRP